MVKRIVISVEVEEKIAGDQDALFDMNQIGIHERVEQIISAYGFNVRVGQSSVQMTNPWPRS